TVDQLQPQRPTLTPEPESLMMIVGITSAIIGYCCILIVLIIIWKEERRKKFLSSIRMFNI
ncbi:hypothetical protein ILYODFUR_037104, partial [Ilyodon furcidens]